MLNMLKKNFKVVISILLIGFSVFGEVNAADCQNLTKFDKVTTWQECVRTEKDNIASFKDKQGKYYIEPIDKRKLKGFQMPKYAKDDKVKSIPDGKYLLFTGDLKTGSIRQIGILDKDMNLIQVNGMSTLYKSKIDKNNILDEFRHPKLLKREELTEHVIGRDAAIMRAASMKKVNNVNKSKLALSLKDADEVKVETKGGDAAVGEQVASTMSNPTQNPNLIKMPTYGQSQDGRITQCKARGGIWTGGECYVDKRTDAGKIEEERQRVIKYNKALSDARGSVEIGDCTRMLDHNGFVKYDGCKGDGFTEFMAMFDVLIKWAVKLALIIAAAMVFYAGFLYLASAADPGKKSKAKEIWKLVAIGLFWVFFAFAIIKLILNTFAVGGVDGEYSGLKENSGGKSYKTK